ncbi:response regulator [Candidatus Chlorohelix sp.]|uniref:response regulator n=1 Tax=Candidatus Chlorohelix sp. TaxID=3139201 RepID=UPI00306ACC94
METLSVQIQPVVFKILIMDDESAIRTLLKRALINLGYKVLEAADGKQTLKIYAEEKMSGEPVSVVIMDLTIPEGMGGEETIKKLLEFDPEAKAIVSSGYSTSPVMSNFYEYGFKAVLAKPYTLVELKKTIARVLRTNV